MADQKAAVMDQQKTNTAPPTEAQALAKRESNQTPSVITTPGEYTDSLQRWQSARFHVLSPAVNFSGLPPQHGMVAALVQLNPDPAAGEVYQDKLFCDEGEVAIAKIGLSKIAQAAGMTIKTERTDPRTIPYYWEVRATARYIGLDGTPQELDATVEYDLRDSAPRLQKVIAAARKKNRDPQSQIDGMRMHGLRGAEARAINAAIRLFGVKQKYSVAELRKPFVCLRVMFQPNMADPEQARIVTERALQGTTALYPQARGTLVASTGPEVLDVIGEGADTRAPKHVGSGAAEEERSAQARDAKADEPPTPDAVRIVDVKDKSGETNGRKWTKFTVIDSNDQSYSTFDAKLRDIAEECKKSRAWVEVSYETEGQYRNLIEIAPAGQNPSLPGLGEL